MENTYKSKPNGGHSNLSRLLLLLFLAGLQPVLSTHAENTDQDDNDTEGLEVVIGGPDYVTVGVPSSIECEATNCSACNYSMSLNGQPSPGQGNVLSFTLSQWMEALTVTCTATDGDTKLTATKPLQVLVGPANIFITGPDVINATANYTYSCNAHCLPSCTYAWELAGGTWITGLGNVVSITPNDMSSSITVICKASNNVSGLFVAAAKNINVTHRNLSTRPVETSAVLLLAFIISAAFIL